MQRQPRRAAASKAVQKPRKGPKENAKNNRSRAETPAARKTRSQLSSIHCQLSGRVQPVHWLAGGGAGPAEPGVAVQTVGQIGAVGRVTALVLDQLRLFGKGHGGPEGIQGWNLRRQSRPLSAWGHRRDCRPAASPRAPAVGQAGWSLSRYGPGVTGLRPRDPVWLGQFAMWSLPGRWDPRAPPAVAACSRWAAGRSRRRPVSPFMSRPVMRGGGSEK